MMETVRIDISQAPDSFVSVVRSVMGPDRGIGDVEFFLRGEVPTAALVQRDESGNVVAVKLLGCPLCIRPRISKDKNGGMVISGKPAIPWSAVSDDEHTGPLKGMIALCPDCKCPVFDVKTTRGVLFGKRELPSDD